MVMLVFKAMQELWNIGLDRIVLKNAEKIINTEDDEV